MPKATTVLVCRECKHHRSVVRGLNASDRITVRLVGCQKVCEQPVCGLRTDDGITWFGKMDKPERQQALVAYVADGSRGRLPKVLDKVRSKKRSKSPR